MKKFIFSALVALFVLTSIDTQAQKTSKTFSLGLGLEAAVPTGDFKNLYSFAPGLTIRASYKLGPGFATLTTGGLIFIPKDLGEGDNLHIGLQIPVKAGYKFIFKEHFFAMGEMGFSNFRSFFEGFDGNIESVGRTGFTVAPGVGFQAGAFEIGLRYEYTGFSGASLGTAALRLGFNF